ncbi:MAG: alpha/beta hydrolase [Bdellovibrionales bacterium]
MFQTQLFESYFIPSPKPSRKIMIVFHGRGDSLKPFKKFQEELNLDNINYLLLNAPRKYLGGFSWYGEPPFERQGVLKIRQRVFQLLKELEDSGWNSQDIFLLGFSQGCLVSADVGLNYEKKLGGVVGVSGYFHFFPRWRNQLTQKSRQTPWLFTHGKKDEILDFKETHHGVEKLKSEGLNVSWVLSEKKHIFSEQDYPIIRKWVRNQMSSLNARTSFNN